MKQIIIIIKNKIFYKHKQYKKKLFYKKLINKLKQRNQKFKINKTIKILNSFIFKITLKIYLLLI